MIYFKKKKTKNSQVNATATSKMNLPFNKNIVFIRTVNCLLYNYLLLECRFLSQKTCICAFGLHKLILNISRAIWKITASGFLFIKLNCLNRWTYPTHYLHIRSTLSMANTTMAIKSFTPWFPSLLEYPGELLLAGSLSEEPTFTLLGTGWKVTISCYLVAPKHFLLYRSSIKVILHFQWQQHNRMITAWK